MDDMKQMMQDLKQTEGQEFDKKFVEAMSMHHKQGIDMAKMVEEKGQSPMLKEMANEMIEEQKEEIEEMASMNL